MPAKLMYLLYAGLVVATWAYFDLRAQASEAAIVGKANEIALSSAQADINTIKQTQAIQTQRVNDFIDSSERLYSRYFREYSDPDKYKQFPH